MQRKHLQENDSSKFLLEEYRALEGRFQSYRVEGVSRLNSYLTLTSVLGGAGLFFLGNSANLSAVVSHSILIAVMLLLSSVGYDAWYYIIIRQITSDKIERGLSRIRHYFIEQDQSISKYLVNSINDDPTLYLRRQKKSNGVRRTVQTIQAFTLSIAVLSAANLTLPTLKEWVILLGLAAFAIDFGLFEYIGNRRFAREQERVTEKSVFPDNNTSNRSQKVVRK